MAMRTPKTMWAVAFRYGKEKGGGLVGPLRADAELGLCQLMVRRSVERTGSLNSVSTLNP